MPSTTHIRSHERGHTYNDTPLKRENFSFDFTHQVYNYEQAVKVERHLNNSKGIRPGFVAYVREIPGHQGFYRVMVGTKRAEAQSAYSRMNERRKSRQ